MKELCNIYVVAVRLKLLCDVSNLNPNIVLSTYNVSYPQVFQLYLLNK